MSRPENTWTNRLNSLPEHLPYSDVRCHPRTQHIFTGDVICHVYHSWEDGSWSFLPDRETQSEDCLIVCLHHIYERDPSIGYLADLPYG